MLRYNFTFILATNLEVPKNYKIGKNCFMLMRQRAEIQRHFLWFCTNELCRNDECGTWLTLRRQSRRMWCASVTLLQEDSLSNVSSFVTLRAERPGEDPNLSPDRGKIFLLSTQTWFLRWSPSLWGLRHLCSPGTRVQKICGGSLVGWLQQLLILNSPLGFQSPQKGIFLLVKGIS